MENRIQLQMDYMLNNPDVQICGGQICMFKENAKNIVSVTNHSSITLKEYKEKPIHWIVNHPTLCYRKNAIIDIGNYNEEYNKIEDFELMLRMLKKYEYIHNMSEPLLYYRLHDEQVTYKCRYVEGNDYWHQKRMKLIKELCTQGT
jgi:hypothetical protein